MRKWFTDRLWFLIAVGVLYGIFAIVLAILWGRSAPLPGTKTPLSLGWLWLGAVAVYTALSFRTVETREKAVKTVFKRDIQNVPRGLTFVPFFICDLIAFDRTIIFLEVGTPQELPVRGEKGVIVGTQPAISGQEVLRASTEPLRVTYASFEGAIWPKQWYLPEEENEGDTEKRKKRFPQTDHLSRRLTSDPNVVVWFTIRDQSQFVAVIGSREKALELMERVTMVALQEYCSKRSLSFVLHHLEDAQDYLRHRLEQLVGDTDARKRAEERAEKVKVEKGETSEVYKFARDTLTQGWDEKDSWGVDIHGVKIKTMGLPRRVNEAMANTRQAGYEADATIIKAEAERQKLELEAQGKRAQEREVLLGRMEGYRAQKEELGLSAEQILAADTGRAVAENVGNLVVTDQTLLSDALGVLGAGKSVLGGLPAPRPPKKRRGGGTGGSPPPSPPPPASDASGS